MGKWLLWRIRWKQRLVVQSLTIKLSAILELHYFLDYLYFDYEDVKWRGKLKSFKYFSIIRTEAILIIYLRQALSEFRKQYPTLDNKKKRWKNQFNLFLLISWLLFARKTYIRIISSWLRQGWWYMQLSGAWHTLEPCFSWGMDFFSLFVQHETNKNWRIF